MDAQAARKAATIAAFEQYTGKTLHRLQRVYDETSTVARATFTDGTVVDALFEGNVLTAANLEEVALDSWPPKRK